MNDFCQLKSFGNFLKRNKLFTAINVFGFAVSLMFVVLIGLYIQTEISVNASQQNKERIFRFTGSGATTVAPPTGPVLANRYPEIESYTGVFYQSGWNVQVKSDNSSGERWLATSMLTDSSFFRVFSFPFVQGDASQALRTKKDVVLTESYARKLFGNEPALGKVIDVNGIDGMIVSGVVRDFRDTHFTNPDVIMWLENLSDMWGMNLMGHWGWCAVELYLMSAPQADLLAKTDELNDYLHSSEAFWLFYNDSTNRASLEPLEEVYFSPKTRSETIRSNDSRFLMVLAATALLVLIFAVINYINLSVAQSGFRAQEASIRRLLGGSKGSLFAGFVLESLIICFVSFFLGVLLARLAQSWFGGMLGCEISVAEGMTGGGMLFALGGVVLIGIISGLVPAYTLTRFKPIDVVRGTFRRKTKMVYSKVLIAFQYCITIALIGCTVTVIWQTRFMMKTDLGYDHDYLMTCGNVAENATERAAIRSQLMAIPGVEQVAFSCGTPADGGNNNTTQDKEGNRHSFQVFMGDSAYMEMMGFEILRRTGVEDERAVWINETAWKQLGLADDATECLDPAGDGNAKVKLRGMVRDFHTSDLSRPIGEAMIRPLEPDTYAWNILIRVSPADPFATLNRIRDWYNHQVGGQLFTGSFLDQQIQSMYVAQERTAGILSNLSLIAILISALGMLAMSTYFMRQRAQEIAVRKVFGATDREVLTRLVMSFLRLVLVAFVVAVPVIWYLMNNWLSGYAYRIPLSWTIFALAGATAFVIAFAAVLWQSMKATRANPILAIKD